MALKRRNKVDASFSMSSMTDIVFLLLIFFMVTSTLISPNALKLMLPQSNNQTKAKPMTSISIKQEPNKLIYSINDDGKQVKCSYNQIEPMLQEILGDNPDAFISLHMDKTIAVEEMVKVMNIARRNNYKLILATSPER